MKEIVSRRSIRKYTSVPIEDSKINQLLESARLAPSGSNTQPWHFIVVKSAEGRQKLADASHDQQWMMTAPVFIVCVADLSSRLNEYIAIDENSPQEEVKQIIRDTSISIDHILLEADNLGLGTCWVAWYTQEKIRPLLNIPSDKYVVGIITVGYAAEAPKPRPRKRFDEIVHYEVW